jgi:transaldolase
VVGRLDDWLKVVSEKQNIAIDPGYLEWGGIPCSKNLQERGYRPRLLSAAFRNHMHWSEFIGGDLVISPPHRWQVRFNKSDVCVEERIHKPVPEHVVDTLMSKFADFRRANSGNGLTVQEFDIFAPTVRTLRQFVEACHELDNRVRDVLLPNPDLTR